MKEINGDGVTNEHVDHLYIDLGSGRESNMFQSTISSYSIHSDSWRNEKKRNRDDSPVDWYR
jgi:hypothetical protein